ncbi:amino acid adenylation domain-containing protein [Actinophytocola sediminis]
MTDLADRIRDLPAGRRAELRLRLWNEGMDTAAIDAADGDVSDGAAPATFAQRRMVFLHQLAPDSAAYTSAVRYRLTGELDVSALELALADVLARHAVLRTVLPVREGRPTQRVRPPRPAHMSIVDLNGLAEAERLVAEAQAEPFDLAAGPLVRFRLLRLGERESLLLCVFHHAVVDGWSLGVFERDLAACYDARCAGRVASLPALPLEHIEYARWQEEWLAGDEAGRQLAYWTGRLAGAPDRLTLPVDRPRPATPSLRGADHRFTVPIDVHNGLNELGRRHGATLFMVLLSAFQVVLGRFAGQHDVVVGTPVANRRHRAFHDLLGFFANSVALRTTIEQAEPFDGLLARVRASCLDAYEHQDVPLDVLAQRLRPDRDLGRNPLYQVNCTLHNTPEPAGSMRGLTVDRTHVPDTAARFDLDLNVRETATGLDCVLVYAADLFDTSTVERLAEALVRVLAAVVSAPGTTVGELPLADPDELDRDQRRWNATTTARPDNPLVHELVAASALSTSDDVAVSTPWGLRMTYRQLDRRANALAHRLRADGAGRGVPVAVKLARSPELVVALLGVLKAGAAYVPVDPTHPPARIDHVLRDSGASIVLTDADGLADLGDGVDHPPVIDAHADDPAYLIYTSGSTGGPKGTLLPHRAVANYLLWAVESYGVLAGEVVPVHTSAAVDLTVTSLFVPLLAGAELLLLDESDGPGAALAASAAEDTDLGFVKLTPSHLRLLADAGPTPARWTRTLVIGGEDLRESHLEPWRAHPDVRLVNEYGPTETAVACAAHDARAAVPTGRVPIGTPIHNARLHVLDERLHPVPPGVPGELYVGGAGLASGYWNRTALTAQRFLPDPFATEPGGRLYRTGDLVRRLADGAMEYLGRVDEQVKVRGNRIEPGELETLLESHSAVRESVVDVDQDGELVAFVSVDPPAGPDREDHRVGEWTSVYEDTYRAGETDADPGFDLTGWTSGVTGEPLDPEEMATWLADTVERVRVLRPRRVVELGCGSGLVLHRVAPDCEYYLGVDVSATVIDRLAAHVPGDHVELRVAPAHRALRHGDEVDTVILNSVAQYFPSAEYLVSVLERAVAAMPAGGHVFLGDVRNLLLLRTFHAAALAATADPGTPLGDLAAEVASRVDGEEELCLDPRLFTGLPARLPRITSARVLVKRGAYRNELNGYRYDVVLTVDGTGESTEPVAELDWPGLSDVERILVRDRPAALVVRAVPNARVGAAVTLTEQLRTGPPDLPLSLLSIVDESGVEPEDVLALAERHPYQVELSWAGAHPDGAFDLLLTRHGAPPCAAPAVPPGTGHANDPLWRPAATAVVPELERLLREHVPVPPARYVLLRELPITPAGKRDRPALRRLAARATGAASDVDAAHPVPLTPTEERVAAIWRELLARDHIRAHDDFFDLGGHSLLTFQLVFRLRTEFDVEVPIRAPFQAPKLAELAVLVDELGGGSATRQPTLVVVRRDPLMPTSFAQQRLWFLHQLAPDSHQYNYPVFLRLGGDLDVTSLEYALGEIVRRHEVLRTALVTVDGRPFQQIHPHPGVDLPVVDLSTLPAERREAETLALARGQYTRPFDLAEPPMFRALLVRLSAAEHVLLFMVHHVVMDGWSTGLLLGELTELYAAHRDGRPARLPELPVQYADYAVWQRGLLDEGHHDRLRDHWLRRLDGVLDLPGIPLDHPRPARPANLGRDLEFRIPAGTADAIRELCREEDSTPFMALLAALYALLHQRTGETDLVVGSDVANRSDTAVEKLIGFFVNQVVLRADLTGAPTWRELLGRTRTVALDAYAHQDLPFEEVVKALNPRRGRNHSPLFQVKLVLNNTPPGRTVPGLELRPYDRKVIDSSRFDLAVVLQEDGAGFTGSWQYDAELFDTATMAELMARYGALVGELAAWPDQRPGRLLSPAGGPA